MCSTDLVEILLLDMRLPLQKWRLTSSWNLRILLRFLVLEWQVIKEEAVWATTILLENKINYSTTRRRRVRRGFCSKDPMVGGLARTQPLMMDSFSIGPWVKEFLLKIGNTNGISPIMMILNSLHLDYYEAHCHAKPKSF